MSNIKLSIDRIVIKYRDVYWSFFNPFKQSICDYYGIKEYIGKTGFKYHLHIRECPDRYFHISYQLCYAPKSKKHPLRIETHPDHLEHFKPILDALRAHASSIWFVRCDVAFDIPRPMNQVFTASRTGRRMNLYEGTRYYGGKRQRQQAGYCRVYDKREEQRERKRKDIGGELTRVEIVYKPEEKILMDSLVQFPPTLNNLYSCFILTDVTPLKPEKRAMLLVVHQGLMTMDDFTPHHRRMIQKLLESQETIDFDQIAQKQWGENMSALCTLLCRAEF